MLVANRWYARLALFATVLAVCVIILGAYTRIKDAGLGCPDWPGCYGQLTVPQTAHALAKAQQAFPTATIEPAKAWPEMIHRYLAGGLGIIVMLLTVIGLWRKRAWQLPLGVLLALAGLIVFQGLLGKWTVTLKLLPVVVMSHLLGGLTIAALVWGLALYTLGWLRPTHTEQSQVLRPWAVLGLVILALQIFLGGWTSTNYAGIACPDFPFCYGNPWPAMNFSEAFRLWMPIGPDYQGGNLSENAKITIQMMHRVGALVTALYLGWLSLRLLQVNNRTLRRLAYLLLILLLVQLGLGIANVLLRLPLHLAVSHNAVAAFLVLTMVSINFSLFVQARGEMR
jgi:cytochrome c oxidase assembly protein subunit 15